MNKRKSFLVTGCAGFVPGHLIEYLLEHNYQVIGLDDLSIGRKQAMASFIKHPQFEFVKADVRDRKVLKKLVAKVDYIYHGAVRGVTVSTDLPIEDLRVNTESTLTLLELAKENKITQFIYPSSASVYGNPKRLPEKEEDNPLPLSPYGVSKLASERYCLAYHHLYSLPVVCLRYFNTYGPRQRRDSIYGGVISVFFDQALKGKKLTVYGKGEQTRDFVFISDNIRATVAAIDNKKVNGQVINVATGKEVTVGNLATVILKTVGKKNQGTKSVRERKIDNIKRRRGDITRAKELLNYQPKVGLKQGLKETFKWFEDNL